MSTGIKDLVLNRIEADVVIVIKSDVSDEGQVIPYWECEMTEEKLNQIAIAGTLYFIEAIGHGTASYRIFDFRE